MFSKKEKKKERKESYHKSKTFREIGLAFQPANILNLSMVCKCEVFGLFNFVQRECTLHSSGVSFWCEF